MSTVTRALDIFSEAVTLDDASRCAYLDQACGADTLLRTQVEKMLNADAKMGAFLEQPIAAKRFDRSGEQLGKYRLDLLIGSGGMGSVYRATRADGAFDKPVAIKLLMFDAGDLRTRFLQERRILGNLSHSHIATLLDVGNDANGAPYFVMEYIDGVPITQYVREHGLDLRAKIELFLPILDAVQNAHSQLVVHRDIKPGNVFVDSHGVAKLLDFGIAKLLGDTTRDSAKTQTGIGPLTPEYASPEQVRGQPTGTPSDIYSLGILLYEVLVGQRPYEIDDTSPSGIERVVCHTEPVRPSTLSALSSGAGNARDLDAIVLKALAKSAQRRYASCAEFSSDLKRWLSGLTVLARESTTRERLARYMRRHKLGVSVAAATSLALMVGLAVALWQAQVAREQTRIARSERDRAQRINQFLTDTLGAANPADLGRKATVLDVLQRARLVALNDLAEDPETAATTQLALSRTYRSLGDYSTARDCGIAAVDAAKRAGDSAVLIDADLALGSAHFDLGNYNEARAVLSDARNRALQQGSSMQRGTAAAQLGQVENEQGNTDDAGRWFDVALAELPKSAADQRATTLNGYGFSQHQRGDEAAAADLYRQAAAVITQAYPHGNPVLATYLGNLAASLRGLGKLDEANTVLLDQVLPRQIEQLGENHPDVIWTLCSLVGIERDRKNPEAALKYAIRAKAAAENLPDENDWKAYAFEKYGTTLIFADRSSEAIPILQRALAIDKAVLPEDNASIASVESALGLAQSQTGDRAGGEALARSAYARLLKKYGEKNQYTVVAKANLDSIASSPAR